MAERPDEFSLIAQLFAPLAADAPGAFGLTDDAALYIPAPGMEIVLTVDALVEGVHFFAGDPPETVAAKLLRVNLSDLAAKGATPKAYLLTTAWPSGTSVDWIRRFADGLSRDQRLFGVTLLGGDTVSTSGPMSFSLTAIGEVPQGTMLRRKGAKVGDDLFITGTVGDAALGLAVAGGKLDAHEGDQAFLLERYRVPQPRVTVGQKLRGVASAALDVSDGLMADLGHLCDVSGVGARVEISLLPLSQAARNCLEGDADLLENLLAGGDDYEILFSADPESVSALSSIAVQTGVPITRIGRIVDPGQGIEAIDAQGRPIPLKRRGFRHF